MKRIVCTWIDGEPVAEFSAGEWGLLKRLPSREVVVLAELRAFFPESRFRRADGGPALDLTGASGMQQEAA